MQPTDEQVKEFWEWCGLKQDYAISTHYNSKTKEPILTWYYICPDGISREEPPIDLNSLFEWAMPKVLELGYEVIIFLGNDLCEVEINDKDIPPKKQSQLEQDKDPALALFWAIYGIIK